MIIVMGLMMVLCVAGIGTGYFAYQRAAEPDRANPGVVVSRYVEATFNSRSDTEAKRYTCRSPKLSEVHAMVDDLRQRERTYSTTFQVSPANFVQEVHGKAATITVDLEVRTATSSSRRPWQFSLVDQSGWRVCAARRIT